MQYDRTKTKNFDYKDEKMANAGAKRYNAAKANGAATRYQNLKNSSGGGKINVTKNAAGQEVKIVKRTETKAEPNSITQRTNKKGGIDRNYYGADGVQTKQISNNDHGHKAERDFGKHGEHGHDYYYDENGNLIHGKARELTDEERKENGDIL